jgi:acyl-coenzyme A thioesterase 13
MNSPGHEIPDGYQPVQRPGFAGLWGPFHVKGRGRGFSLGLRIDERHLNTRGSCHGGLIASLADIALGYACATAGDDERNRNFVTIDLAIEYMRSVSPGDWLYSEIRDLNANSRTATAAGEMMVEAGPVAVIRANFRLIQPRGPVPSGDR